MLYQLFNQQPIAQNHYNYSQFMDQVETERVTSVIIQDNELTVTDANQNQYQVIAPNDADLIKTLRQKGVAIEVKPPPENPWYLNVLASWFPMIVLIGVWIFFMRQMQAGGGKAMSFGKSRARLQSDQSDKVTFEDVAGIDEAKEELGEIIDFLKDPKKYTRVGASRVRDLFAQGKKNAPCIIFIDEIDAVGRHRGAGLGGGHDEREQTLNQLLVEMDGFESNEGVILVSATNRPDVLDPALLRPGRFDRQVVVPLPDIKGREGILNVHLKKVPANSDIDALVLAKGTPGFSGADLENLVNEAALLAAKREKEKVDMTDMDEAKDKVYMGLERKSKVVREDDRKNTAYHEAGHALVARFLPDTDAVNKITIIPRGRAAGITWFLPEERDFSSKDQLENTLAVTFGGRAAEELIYNHTSTGASQDIKQATQLAEKMIRSFGMGEELSPLSYAQADDQIFLGREISQHRDYSENTAQKIDAEIARLIDRNYDKSKKILKKNIDVLHKLTELLLEKETVLGKELDELILSLRPDFEFPSSNADKPVENSEKKDADA